MSHPLRILTIGHSYVVSMNRGIVREVARDPEFDITVAAPTFFHGDLRDMSLEPEPPDSPLHLETLETSWTHWIHLFRYDTRALRDLVRRGQFDLVHAWEEPYIFAGYQIARSLNDVSARFCFRTAQSYSKLLPPPFRHFERTTLARAQGWIAGGRLVHQAMRQRGYPDQSGRILTLAVDTTRFQPRSETDRKSIRDRLGLQEPIIGFLGRLTADKGLRILMKALDRIGAQSSWNLLLLGSGPLRAEILAWATRRGWSDRVHIHLARHDEVPDLLAAMDFLVAPSQTTRHWKEQFGRMLIEAFASGVPVIASDSGEIPHVVADAGVIVPERDVTAWANAIDQLLNDPQRRELLASKGLERCKKFSVATVAQQYRDYYRWLAGQSL